MPRHPRKISIVLLEFAEPLLRVLPPDADADALRPMFALASLVWNAVVFELRGNPKPFLEEARALIAREFEGQHRNALLTVVAELEAAKRRESPPDLRVITRFELFEDGPDGLTLRAEATNVPKDPAAKRPRKSTPRSLPKPDPADAPWLALYQAAAELRALAPWRWLGDDERFGVEDPATGRIDWCVLMGMGGEFAGLAIYLGDAGILQLERMIADDAPEDSAAFGQEALVLGFVDRDQIASDERARMKRLGFTYRGAGAWPQLDSHGLDRLPCAPTEAEARRVVEVIGQVLDVARRAALHPELVLPDERGERLVRVAAGQAGERTWNDARRAVPTPTEPEIPTFDRVRAARLRTTLQRAPIQVECDLFPTPTIVEPPGEAAYSPAMFLVAETKQGTLVHVDLHEPRGREAWAQEQLLRVVESMGARPEAVFVGRARLERVLAPVAAELGIRIERVEELVSVRAARDSLSAYLDGGK